jgi:hypothetical protein
VIHPFIVTIKRAIADRFAERTAPAPQTDEQRAKYDEMLAKLVESDRALKQHAPTTPSLWEEIKALPSALRNQWAARQHRKVCPRCGERGVVEIIYGLVMPGTSHGYVILGGCVEVEGSPHWLCKKCDARLQDADIGFVRAAPKELTNEDVQRALAERTKR